MANIPQGGIEGFKPAWLPLCVPGAASFRPQLLSLGRLAASAAEATQCGDTKAAAGSRPAITPAGQSRSFQADEAVGRGSRSVLVVRMMAMDTTATAASALWLNNGVVWIQTYLKHV